MRSRNVRARNTRRRRVKSGGAKAPKALHPVLEFFLLVGILIFAAAVTSWLSVT